MSPALDPLQPPPWTLGRIAAAIFQKAIENGLEPPEAWEATAIAVIENYAASRKAGDCRTPRQRYEGIPIPPVDACGRCGTTGNRTWGDPAKREGWICLGCGDALA